MEKIKKELHLKSDDVKAEVLYIKDDVRRMQGLYNPEKDKALKDFGDLKSQLGEFLASKIHTLETQFDDKVKRIEAISTEEYPTPARRPPYSALDCSKIKSVFSIQTRPWQDSLAEMLARLFIQEQTNS